MEVIQENPKCDCADWTIQIEKVNAPIMLLYARNPNTYKYDGKPFAYCPWCGNALQ